MNVLIIEDDEYLAGRIRMAFESKVASNRVKAVHSFLDFVNELPVLESYDIFLTDLRLEEAGNAEFSGYRVIRTIREKGIRAPVVVISGYSEIDRLRTAFEYGASDYIIKPVRLRELELRVLNWYKNYALSGRESRENRHWYGELAYDLEKNEFLFREKIIPLTKGNKYVLSVFFTNPGKLLRENCLAEKIWGDVCPLERRNVRVNVLRLKRALSPFGLDGWIRNVRGEGYVFCSPEATSAPE